MQTLRLRRPDDWHLHVRDKDALHSILADTCRQMGRAIIMPNLNPPVTTLAAAQTYYERVLAARPKGSRFEPLMTLYLTDKTTSAELEKAKASGLVKAVKLYPAGATTNSDYGVTHIDKVLSALETMAQIQLPLLVHGEVTDPAVDIFDREARFIETVLQPLLERFPTLPVVFEHITTEEAARYVAHSPYRLAATITAHHLLINRNALFVGGLKPHHYCLPIVKRERHRQALLAAIASGSERFFLGTDSAPHARERKETGCGCAGIYTAHAAIELYAEAFESINALDKLEGFASLYGPAFYGLPPNSDFIVLEKRPQWIPSEKPYADSRLIPFRAGESVAWTLAGT